MIMALQGDITTKVTARQVLVDELESMDDTRPTARKEQIAVPLGVDSSKDTSPSGLPTPAAVSQGRDDATEAMDVDAEGEEEEPITPAGQTPGQESSPAQATEGEEGEDDLFGDDQSHSEDTGAEDDEDDAEGEEDEEDIHAEGEGDDDMAAMLQAELAGSPATPDEQAQANAAAALSDFAMAGGLEQGDSTDQGDALRDYRLGLAGMEGGVGMRRLASGLGVADDDDESSDDSDD